MKSIFSRSKGYERFRIEDDVQAALGVPVLAQIPMIEEEGLCLITDVSAFSPMTEAYRWLRVNLNFVTFDNPVRSLVVTSASPQEGKSTVALNLALAYMLDHKDVVIVDGDLRRPTLHKLLKNDSRPGLTEVITGQCPLDAAIRPIRLVKGRNLSFIPMGSLMPDPTGQLGSDTMKQVLEALEKRFEVVLFDSSPVLVAADAMVLASQVTNTLLVIGSKDTPLSDAQRAVSFLTRARAKIIGVALNRMAGQGLHYYTSQY